MSIIVNAIVNAINKLRLPVPICTEMTQSSDVQGNINKIIIVKVKFILTFTINCVHLYKQHIFGIKKDLSGKPERSFDER